MSITYHIFTTELGPTLAGFIGNEICCLHFADSSASLLSVDSDGDWNGNVHSYQRNAVHASLE
jgi:hypothetical protein